MGPPGWSFSAWVGLPKVGDGAATVLRGKRTEKREESVGSFSQNCCPHPDIPPPRLSNTEQCELGFAPSYVDLETDIDDVCIYTHFTKNMCIERYRSFSTTKKAHF